MFRPHWKDIAPLVVKDLNSCPQKAQQLAELLGVSVADFLLNTQTETIPYLILAKRKDILTRIAQARGKDVTDLWLTPNENFAAVMSKLLTQPAHELEQSVLGALQEVGLANENLSSIVNQAGPIQTACELLKIAAGGNDPQKEQVCSFNQPLGHLANLGIRLTKGSKP
jgi:serine/threonine-protein kinase ATR